MANFPNSVTTFATRSAGQKVASAHVNALQDEVNAIEDGYLNGTARLNSSHSTLAALSVIGNSTLASSITIGTLPYIFPAAGGSTGHVLTIDSTSGSTMTLKWASGASSAAADGFTISTGVLTLNHGQVKFPAVQVPSADVNTLDDYEEGTWTPVIGGSGGTSGQTYAAQTAKYVKVGKFVFVAGYVALSNKGTITGNVEIQGLPFTADGATYIGTIHFGYWASLATNSNYMAGRINNGATSFLLLRNTAASTDMGTVMATADIGNGTAFMFSASYQAAA